MDISRNIERFEKKYVKSQNECWEWTAGRKGSGYGVFYFHGKLHGAHRVSLALYRGLSVDTTDHCLHSCDNPGCVNPDHLRYGSRSENMRDCVSRGRWVRVQDWSGTKNPKSKLDTSAMREVREAISQGRSNKSIAAQFGVTSVRISQIRKTKGAWKIEEF